MLFSRPERNRHNNEGPTPEIQDFRKISRNLHAYRVDKKDEHPVIVLTLGSLSTVRAAYMLKTYI